MPGGWYADVRELPCLQQDLLRILFVHRGSVFSLGSGVVSGVSAGCPRTSSEVSHLVSASHLMGAVGSIIMCGLSLSGYLVLMFVEEGALQDLKSTFPQEKSYVPSA